MNRSDLQWWAGAAAAAVLAAAGALKGTHPYDLYIGALGAALMGFALFKVTPPGSVKE